MKTSALFVLALLLGSDLTAQMTWREVLTKSSGYYLTKKDGSVTGRAKMVFNGSDSLDFHFNMDYYRNDSSLARYNTSNAPGYSIFKNERYYHVDPAEKTFGAYGADVTSKFVIVPHYSPERFFSIYSNANNKKSSLIDNTNQSYYILDLELDDRHTTMMIDKTSYQIIGYVDIYHPRLPYRTIEANFSDTTSQRSFGEINSELENIIANYTGRVRTTIPDSKTAAKNQKKLLGEKLDRGALNALLFNSDTSYQNHYVLLDHFFQSCGPCIQSIPYLNELQQKFANKLIVIGIDGDYSDEGKKDEYMRKRNVEYQIIDGETARKIQALNLPDALNAFPTLSLIAPDGTIKKILVGYSLDHFRQLKAVLK